MVLLAAATVATLLATPAVAQPAVTPPVEEQPAPASPTPDQPVPAPSAQDQPAPTPSGLDQPATYVGEKYCAFCHSFENLHFGDTLHARVFRQNPRNENEARVCEAYHGPGSKHAKSPLDHTLLIGFTKNWGTPTAVQNAQCLGCHQGAERLQWPGSTHETNLLACSDCHNPMARFSATGLLAKASISETCYTCHQQQRVEFRRRSHMPLPESKMSCVDCHNPHGSTTRPLLKAVSVNEVCYQCPAEKRGPCLWEHAPVRERCHQLPPAARLES